VLDIKIRKHATDRGACPQLARGRKQGRGEICRITSSRNFDGVTDAVALYHDRERWGSLVLPSALHGEGIAHIWP
jgi:hypothetical protein